jgi:L-asparaginase
MKNILVIFTGGTIGSTVTKGTINTDPSTHFLLLDMFYKHYSNHKNIHFKTLQPYHLLSENLTPGVWTTLIQTIERTNPTHFDGIIVTHGTDTLAYTAAALGLYFNALPIPIFLVSSQLPLDNPDANGLDNFNFAVNAIINGNPAGIFVPYRNPCDAKVSCHNATQLSCSPQLSNDFFSIKTRKETPILTERKSQTVPLKPYFSDKILMIKPYPGLDYTHFDLSDIQAILHDVYHSGTACTTTQWGDSVSVLPFIKKCQQHHIPVFFAPMFNSSDCYQSTVDFIAHGAEILWNMTLETTYVKLCLAYGNFESRADIMSFMHQPIADEML